MLIQRNDPCAGIGPALLVALALVIATPAIPVAQAPPAKSARAVRLAGPAPHIDGQLDDPAWQRATVIADFVQKIPVEGATPSVDTEVRLLYDDHALYVDARLRRHDPSAIRRSSSSARPPWPAGTTAAFSSTCGSISRRR